MSFWPQALPIRDIWVTSLGALISGILGSVAILVITFLSSGLINIPQTYLESKASLNTTAFFPIVLSIISFFAISLTQFLSYGVLRMTQPERYKKSSVIIGQMFFFALFLYLILAPIYIYVGLISYEHILSLFLFHVLIQSFWTSILIEVLNNYRYILIGIYGSFFGLLVSFMITLLIYSSFQHGQAQLISLVLLLPLINFANTFFKQLFDFAYYKYYTFSNQDPLGDIFYQIELAEKEELLEEEEKNML